MSEQHQTPKSSRWRTNLGAMRAILLVAGTGLVYLWLAERLSIVELLIAAAVLAFVATQSPPARQSPTRQMPAEAPDRSTLSDATLTRIADAMADPCFLLDPRGVLDYKNPAAAEIFPQAQRGDLLTLTLRHPQFVATLDEVISTGKSAQLTFLERFPSERWYKARLSAIHGPDEDIADHQDSADHQVAADNNVPMAKILVMLNELTAQKRSEQMHADFVANVSHELRTPLTAVIGYLDTLIGPAKDDPAARQKFLTVMRGQAERMSHLVDDLLSLSRIELKEHMRPKNNVDILQVLEEVADLLRPIAEKTGNQFVIAANITSAEVTGERVELVQVFENLFDNALKYGDPGSAIGIEITKATSSEQFIAVHITNTGVPISAEHLPRLTERFYRVDVESSRAKKGTGLGLAIVKHIVTRHRGQLAIKSDSTTGTTVTIELPK